MNFFRDYKDSRPLLIANVWDVTSAVSAEKAGFAAIGTSSAAIAQMLGYDDGENISFEEVDYIVRRIIASTDLPLTVDLEGGYSRDPKKIADNIARLEGLGVQGINLEDSLVDSGQRKILPISLFEKVLKEITSTLAAKKSKIFINIRTDTYLTNINNKLDESILRANTYKAAGADGIFIPGLSEKTDLDRILKSTDLPLNIMSSSDSETLQSLKYSGIKRISMGNTIHQQEIINLQTTFITIQHQWSIQEKESR